MKIKLVLLAGATALVASLAVMSATAVPAVIGPSNVADVLADAKGGQRIVLAPGDYGVLTLPSATYSPRLRIDASHARFTGLVLRRTRGIEISGGTVNGPRLGQSAVMIDFAQDIQIQGMTISGSRTGIVVSRSQDVGILRNRFDRVRSDGVNVAMSRRVRIESNICRNFDPIPTEYDEEGAVVHDGDHPDCIQGWSNANAAPTADIAVIGNRADGYMQGVFFVTPGQGGFDRIVVRDNIVTVSAFNGIILTDARDSAVAGNVVRAVEGARMRGYPFHPVTPWVRVSGKGSRACGNTVETPRLSDGTEPC